MWMRLNRMCWRKSSVYVCVYMCHSKQPNRFCIATLNKEEDVSLNMLRYLFAILSMSIMLIVIIVCTHKKNVCRCGKDTDDGCANFFRGHKGREIKLFSPSDLFFFKKGEFEMRMWSQHIGWLTHSLSICYIYSDKMYMCGNARNGIRRKSIVITYVHTVILDAQK